MFLSGIISGIVIFLSTGTDDLLVMTALLNGKSSKEHSAILWGTVLGTAIMFIVSLAIGNFLPIHSSPKDYLRFAGLVPLTIGLMYVSKGFSTDFTKVGEASGKSGLWIAMTMYLSNATDDLIVNSSLIIASKDFYQLIGLGIGNLIGAAFYYGIAKRITGLGNSPRFMKFIWGIAGSALILIGFKIVIGE